jgi:hypothetical protein
VNFHRSVRVVAAHCFAVVVAQTSCEFRSRACCGTERASTPQLVVTASIKWRIQETPKLLTKRARKVTAIGTSPKIVELVSKLAKAWREDIVGD